MAVYTNVDNPTLFLNTVLYTGNGSSQSITGVGFQPDWTWIKSRAGTYGAYNPQEYDSVRGAGATKDLTPATNAVEGIDSGAHGFISSFDTDGFTLGAGSSNSTQNNGASTTYVAWNWKAGTAFSNDASATGIGTIDSSGSTNQTVGFSIVGYTGNGSASQSVAHNLGGTPEMIIFKCRETVTDWITFHTKLGGANKNVSLNSTSATGTDTDYFANTNPTSTVFSVGAASNTNRGSEGMIAYCFRSIKGYSKFGTYAGNGNEDGLFIYTGFKPAWLMVKRISTTGAWLMYDSVRNPSNLTDKKLLANEHGAENASASPSGVTASTNNLDLLSNGFKFRRADGYENASGSTYIYMAFAEAPFVTAGTKAPGTAR